jgi:hypothetical protein
MRVVNNVEREMVRAEWENWLVDENTRCSQVQTILRGNRASGSPVKDFKSPGAQRVLEAEKNAGEGKMEGLKKWQEEYCGSCKREQDLLLEGRKHAAVG